MAPSLLMRRDTFMRQKEFRDLVGGILGAEESFQHDVLGALCIDDLSTEIEVLETKVTVCDALLVETAGQ